MGNNLNNTVGAPKAKASNRTPVLAAVVSFLAGLQCAMQLFAHDFEYQSALGAHLGHLSGPWSILRCADRWYGAYNDANMRAGYIGHSVTAVSLIALVMAKMVLADSARSNPYLHGSARWADPKGIHVSDRLRRSRTLWELTTGKAPTAAARVYVGAWLDKRGKHHHLRHNGPECRLSYAPVALAEL